MEYIFVGFIVFIIITLYNAVVGYGDLDVEDVIIAVLTGALWPLAVLIFMAYGIASCLTWAVRTILRGG